MNRETVTSGYLVVKTYERVYREYCAYIKSRGGSTSNRQVYSVPRPGIPSALIQKKYRGISRDPIQAWIEKLRTSDVFDPPDANELEACLFMNELKTQGKAREDFVFSLDHATELLRMIEPPIEREIIWAARTDSEYSTPKATRLLGYEPTAFYIPEHFSALADCIHFPIWHGHDKDGTLFISLHQILNEYGLFDTPEDALAYSKLYLAQDWSEHMDYLIAEIRLVAKELS